MIWGKLLKEKVERVYSCGKWFAWYPIRLKDGRWAWWEYVWRHISESYYSTQYHFEPMEKPE